MAETGDQPIAGPLPVQKSSKSAVTSLARDLCGMSYLYEDGNEDLRLKLLAKARALCTELETPSETMMRQCWAEVCSPIMNQRT